MPAPDVRAIVVPFDGFVADTLSARHDALRGAFQSLAMSLPLQTAPVDLAGCTLAEAARAWYAPGEPDETAIDLVALAASRTLDAAPPRALVPSVIVWLRDRARLGVRLVLRADSMRREVEPVLATTGAHDLFSLVRCSDDLPRLAGASSLESSWHAIDRRLEGVGVPARARASLELDGRAAGVAARYAGNRLTAAGVADHAAAAATSD